MSHTPIPWKVSASDSRIIQGVGRGIATVHSHTTQPAAEGDANAGFIVRCVNSHEALVKALDKIALSCEPADDLDEANGALRDIAGCARAAIKKAKGE